METLQLVERGTDQGHLFFRDGIVPAAQDLAWRKAGPLKSSR